MEHAEGIAVKSARRTIEVLEYFAETHRAAGVSELAGRLGAPLSSTSVLLAGLARLGYLEQDPGDRRYRPTLRVMLLGGWIQDRLLGDSSLLRVMEQLRARTGMSVLIGLQRQAHVQYILTLRRPDLPGDENMRAGMLRPITRAAVGKALLMLKADDEITRILRRANAEEPDPALRFRQGAFLADLRRSRARGWTESAGSMVPGQSVLAMPLPPLQDQPPLAIGLGGPLEDVESHREDLVRSLREVCHFMAAAERRGEQG
ncbi:IclR family transcriptional regulator [Pseudoroseomonas ludipueritiae]|uniref:Helix-turn-helix domain-containing protein n=1 Tax=Pseudoroseomonas ludipueritiae TaxID=198093 RepID=A0ABR7R2C0_9PROT|nr:helix-turn-helix domain-containing protein [Pseudoroseomonas ludipueritiae]MBC9175897.1 helix-turn-helix domain-containing protein [Pseudoroseomonas ludipueritiae]